MIFKLVVTLHERKYTTKVNRRKNQQELYYPLMSLEIAKVLRVALGTKEDKVTNS